MTLRPQEIDAKLIGELKSAGVDTPELNEIAAVAFQFNFINRVADAINFPMPNEKQTKRQAKVLNLMARVVTGGKRPEPYWMTETNGLVRPVELNDAREQLLGNSSSIDSKLRISIEANAASIWGAQRESEELREDLQEYVSTLSKHAYQIHDEMVAGLRDKGYTDSQLFEITLVGAFGVAMAAQERLFEVLYGE